MIARKKFSERLDERKKAWAGLNSDEGDQAAAEAEKQFLKSFEQADPKVRRIAKLLIAHIRNASFLAFSHKGRILELYDELESLRGELAEVRKHAVRYRGVWQAADEYSRGDAVTRSGSLWICLSEELTSEVPGTGSAWQLAHKTGERK